jgi:NAD+ synthase (glutamine-hydrolysing)
MYDVNAGSTKTMVQMVVRYVAETTDDKVLADALFDVLDTPVSPELLPPTRNGEIAQKSEESVGPYNLQDFFLYYLVEQGFTAGKVLRLADIAYGDEFDHDTLKKWLRSYCRRLFNQQFKRSCLQDGPTLNGFSFSPRTGFLMPSDGHSDFYLACVDNLE